MAHIGSCRICTGQTLDTDVHPECLSALYSDFLAQIKKHIIESPQQPLPENLSKLIIDEEFQTMEQIKQTRKNERTTEAEQ